MIPVWQGELLHKTVKRLYGTTNKRDAEHQIAKRIRRLERANLTLHTKQQLQDQKQRNVAEKRKERLKAMEQDSDSEESSTEAGSELRYHISASKKNPQDIFSVIRNNRGDPAYHVCLLK